MNNWRHFNGENLCLIQKAWKSLTISGDTEKTLQIMRALEIGRGGILDRAERLKEKVAKGIALYAIGLTREEIQKLPNLCCSETIHANLKWFVEWDQWFQLEQFILRSFRTVRKQEMNELRTRMLESLLDPNLLRSQSVECRKRIEQEQKELFRRRDMILRAHWPPRERGKNRPKTIFDVGVG